MSPDDMTVVVALDRKTIEQFRVSLPTWMRHRPEMLDMPWFVLYDREQLTLRDVQQPFREHGCQPIAAVCPWPIRHEVQYATQREKMLTAFVYAPLLIHTPWWMKIDTDALAIRPADWLRDEWFIPGGQFEQRPAWIASRWGYTKPANQMAQLDDWGDTVPGLREYPRLNLPFAPGDRRCPHRRMASWLSYYDTEWTARAATYAIDSVGYGRIPVPSQDGYHFYIAARHGDHYVLANQKRLGWTNCSKLEELRRTAARVLTSG